MSLLSIPLTESARRVRPHAPAPTSPNSLDSTPGLHLRSLETIFSEEIGKIIRSIETAINSTVTLGTVLNDIIESGSSDSLPLENAPYAPLLKKVATYVATARDDFRTRFPLPATAPGHAKRAEYVAKAMERIQRLVIRLARKNGIEQEVMERYLTRLKPFLHEVGVLVGESNLGRFGVIELDVLTWCIV